MGFSGGIGGSSKKGSESSTQTQSLDPTYSSALYGNLGSLQATKAAGQQPYGGGLLDLSSPINSVRGLTGYSAPSISASAYNPTSYNPSTYSASTIDRSGIGNVNGGLLSGVDLSKYLSPYTSSVIDAADAASQRDQDRQAQADKASAIAAGAFGGSREGVQRAVTSGIFDQNRQTTRAGLLNQGFLTAEQAAMADLDRQQQAALANQSADLGVATSNAGYQNSAGQFNAGSQNAARAFNAGAQNTGFQFNASQAQSAAQANQAADLASAGVRSNAAGTLGGLLESQHQADYGQYKDSQDYNLQLQQLINQALGLVPTYGTTTSNGQSTGSGFEWGLAGSYGKKS